MTQYFNVNNQVHVLDDGIDPAEYIKQPFAVITKAEADAMLVPPPPTAQQLADEKAIILNQGRELRAVILNRLNGLHVDAIYANDIPPVIAAIMAAKQALKDITIHPTVVAAVGGEQTKAAILTRYYEIAAQLQIDAPSAVTAFTGLDL